MVTHLPDCDVQLWGVAHRCGGGGGGGCGAARPSHGTKDTRYLQFSLKFSVLSSFGQKRSFLEGVLVETQSAPCSVESEELWGFSNLQGRPRAISVVVPPIADPAMVPIEKFDWPTVKIHDKSPWSEDSFPRQNTLDLFQSAFLLA